jgi:hypothetical protein
MSLTTDADAVALGAVAAIGALVASRANMTAR